MIRIESIRSKNVQEISKQLARLGKDFEMFAREWEDFSNKLEKATSGREKLDKRVGKITTKFDAIKENDTASLIEEKDISDLSEEE